MARFFHFKTLEALLAAAKDLGLEFEAQSDLRPLFEPCTIGTRRVGNRLCIQPMEGCDGDREGNPGELTFRRYRRFGDGGAKIIWGEAAAILPEARANPRQLIAGAAQRDQLARLADACRAAHREAWGATDDLLIGLQLTHSGRYSYPRPFLACHDPLLDPRTIVNPSTGRKADSTYPLLSDCELLRIEEAYVKAAQVAQSAGFDFVDIKQCHRYLLNELLSAQTRPGDFGGSYENRTRLARGIVLRIRETCPNLLIASRLNAYDGIPFHRGTDTRGTPDPIPGLLECYWGTDRAAPFAMDLKEPLRWVRDMKQLGVSLLNITMGNPYASPHLLRPFEFPPPDGYESPDHPLVGVDRHQEATAILQRAVPDLPCVGSGYSWLQEYLFPIASANVRLRKVSLVGVGRGALAQPDFCRQLLQHGKLDRRRVCRTFSYCTALMRAKHHPWGQYATGCPPFDKEVYKPIWDEVKNAQNANLACQKS